MRVRFDASAGRSGVWPGGDRPGTRHRLIGAIASHACRKTCHPRRHAERRRCAVGRQDIAADRAQFIIRRAAQVLMTGVACLLAQRLQCLKPLARHRLFGFQHFDEGVEETGGVVGAGAGLGRREMRIGYSQVCHPLWAHLTLTTGGANLFACRLRVSGKFFAQPGNSFPARRQTRKHK